MAPGVRSGHASRQPWLSPPTYSGGRRLADPPGQYLTRDFSVLSADPTARTPLDEWSLTVDGAVEPALSWTWEELLALRQETVTVDIHCVTKWSKLDTTWTGVPVDSLLDAVETSADFVTACCDGGYTTNLPLEDLTGGRAWVVHAYGGEPLSSPSTAGLHGCSCRICTSGRARRRRRDSAGAHDHP